MAAGPSLIETGAQAVLCSFADRRLMKESVGDLDLTPFSFPFVEFVVFTGAQVAQSTIPRWRQGIEVRSQLGVSNGLRIRWRRVRTKVYNYISM
jgi:hypothetical protein